MLHMQPAHRIALLLTQPIADPKIEFPSHDREHQRQLERVRDSLLLRPEPRNGDRREA